jgi:hypothetical protein
VCPTCIFGKPPDATQIKNVPWRSEIKIFAPRGSASKPEALRVAKTQTKGNAQMIKTLWIIAIILALPTAGISILVAIICSIFFIYASSKILTWIESAIENESYKMEYSNISYHNVKEYAKCKTSRIITHGAKNDPAYIEFEAIINNKKYFVTLKKAKNGIGSVLTSSAAS